MFLLFFCLAGIFLMCDSASASWVLRQLDPNRRAAGKGAEEWPGLEVPGALVLLTVEEGGPKGTKIPLSWG